MNKNLLKYSLLSTLLISLTLGDHNCFKSFNDSCADEEQSPEGLHRQIQG